MIHRWLPEAASNEAAWLDSVLVAVHWHVLIVFALWLTVFAVALYRFRASRQPVPSATGPRPLWAALAIGFVLVGDVLLLATRALPAWYARTSPPPASEEPPLEVHVAAEQFAWQVHYAGPDGRFGRVDPALISPSNPVGIERTSPGAADDIGLTNLLVLPNQRTVVVHLSSRDVVHSFTLPQMRVKQDATPGFVTRTWFTPSREGAWEIACSQLCGLGHYRMRGEYRVVSREAWTEWLDEEVQRLQ